MFFVAGMMMVFGTVIALAPNLDLLLAPVRGRSPPWTAAPCHRGRPGLSGLSPLSHGRWSGALLAGLLHNGGDGLYRRLDYAEL